MTDNDRWQIMTDDRWPTMTNYRKWQITDNDGWHIMTDNGRYDLYKELPVTKS